MLAVSLVASAPADASDREGLAAGSLQLFPGLRLETGLDSNPYFQAAELDPQPSASILINPYVGARTHEPRALELSADLGAVWEQYLAKESSTTDQTGPDDQSGLDLEAGVGLRFNPIGSVSLAPSDRITWATTPNLNPTGDPYRNLYNEFDLELALHPGGFHKRDRLGLSGELGFQHRLWRYDQLDDFDRSAIEGRLELQWNFLPRTAVFATGSVEKMMFETSQVVATTINGSAAVDNIDSVAIRGAGGFSGLLTRRLSLLASAGYGVGNYDVGPAEKTYLAHIEFGIHASEYARIRFGWEHNFAVALLSTHLTFHRAYLSASTTVGRLGVGVSGSVRINDHNTPTRDGAEVDLYNGERQDTVLGGEVDLNWSATDWLALGIRYAPSFRDSTATFTDTSGTGISSDYIQHRAFFYLDLAVARPLPLAGVTGSTGGRLTR